MRLRNASVFTGQAVRYDNGDRFEVHVLGMYDTGAVVVAATTHRDTADRQTDQYVYERQPSRAQLESGRPPPAAVLVTMLNGRSHYERLKVAPDASAEQIRRAYRAKMRRAHPDRGGSEDLARELSAAYTVLKDAERRREYDLELSHAGGSDEQLVDDLEADVVVDDWGTETPIHQWASAPVPGWPPPPFPPWGQPPPPPTLWPQGFESPPVSKPTKPWHRLWLLGDGAWVQTARVLTVSSCSP